MSRKSKFDATLGMSPDAFEAPTEALEMPKEALEFAQKSVDQAQVAFEKVKDVRNERPRQ